MTILESLKNDVRVRDRLLKKRILTEDGVAKSLAELKDSAEQAVELDLPQPALHASSERSESGFRAALTARGTTPSSLVRPAATESPASADWDESNADEDRDLDEDEDDDDDDDLDDESASGEQAEEAPVFTQAELPAAHASPAEPVRETTTEEGDAIVGEEER